MVPELHRLTAEKLARIFGPEKGPRLVVTLLAELGLEQIESVDDLARVAEALQQRGGFEGTAGALLAVQAAMRRVPAATP